MGYLGLFETTQEALGPFLGLSGEGGLEEILGLGIWAHFGGNFRSIWAYPGGPGPILYERAGVEKLLARRACFGLSGLFETTQEALGAFLGLSRGTRGEF